ncbi:ThuA domain-containing protein [Paenibacillus sp. ATY16]|uniref:ThuA domain-containing protein n=1 Tax=Paenibacillus sp. ATY16 TaxID=1759312 RepID=UPI00200ECA69|nr:ThuA domain-containing protein [Paenibacillus sp. ATY16]MCK9862193.1 ThuA domain-containing protein [Paenibacillus sp. ATY16]
MKQIKVTVWNEYRHEKHNEHVKGIYPEGIHNAIGGYLKTIEGLEVGTATLDEPEHGLTDDVLNNTDVLIWWGHLAHHEVRDDIAEKVRDRVLQGMGLIVLHSGHASKVFEKLLGTKTGALKWRDDGEKERLWVIEHGHPIADGLGEYIEIPKEEMYGERFEIPAPDELVFISWFEGGEVFRSGCCYRRGKGKLFYFRPGHETFPIYHQPEILHVIKNAVNWAAPIHGAAASYGRVEPLEKISK